MKLLLLSLLSLSTLFAADPPKLPADVQKVVEAREAAVAKAKAVLDAAQKAYDAAVVKANADAVKALGPVVVKLTKSGDLEGAVAAKKLVGEWGVVEKVDLAKAIVNGVWRYDRPDGEYFRLDKGGDLSAWWANKPFSEKNPIDARGTWQKESGQLVINFSGRVWKVPLTNNEELAATDQNGGTFRICRVE